MKKFRWSDILNEMSLVSLLLCSFLAVATFSVSTPAFIAALVGAGASVGGIVGTAVYNHKEIKRKNKELEEQNQENQKEIENMATLENSNEDILNMSFDEIISGKVEKSEKIEKKNNR